MKLFVRSKLGTGPQTNIMRSPVKNKNGDGTLVSRVQNYNFVKLWGEKCYLDIL